jgi:hypothetical protein
VSEGVREWSCVLAMMSPQAKRAPEVRLLVRIGLDLRRER